MGRIVWTDSALANLKSYRDYLFERAPLTADRFIGKLVSSVNRLETFPLSGMPVPEFRNLEIRQVIFEGFRILYYIYEGDCHIGAVIHGSRDLIRHVDPTTWAKRPD